MIKIKNLNSLYFNLYEYIEKQIIRRLEFLLDKFWSIPIYLVDESLMDFLYPPHKRKVLNEECVKEILNVKTDKANIEEIFELLNRCRERIIVAAGVYKPCLSQQEILEIEKRTNHQISNGEAIFICPEQILEWSRECGKYISELLPFEKSIFKPNWRMHHIIFLLVLTHELAHAYMNDSVKAQYANELWYAIIEESIANAIAYKHFLKKEEKIIISCAMARQPLEYRGYIYWMQEDKKYVDYLARIWKLIMLPNSFFRYFGWFDYCDWYYIWRFWRISDIPRNQEEKIKLLKELALEILKSGL